MKEQDEKDDGAELAAVGNDTTVAQIETASNLAMFIDSKLTRYWTTFEDGFHGLDPAPPNRGDWLKRSDVIRLATELDGIAQSLLMSVRRFVASCRCRGTGAYRTNCTLCSAGNTYHLNCDSRHATCEDGACALGRAVIECVDGIGVGSGNQEAPKNSVATSRSEAP